MDRRPLTKDYRPSDPDELSQIRRIANAIGNAEAQSSAMNQNARGPNAP